MRTILLPLLLAFSFCAAAQVKVGKLRTENQLQPAALDVRQPRFSWQLQTDKRAVMQTAYELEVANKGGKTIWQSGKVASPQSVLVAYAGPALQPNTGYQWRVWVWDNGSKASAWSAYAGWQMGLLSPANWTAKWIESQLPEEPGRPNPLMRKEFNLGKKIAKATAYVTAHGLYEAHINCKRVGDAYLTPGWTVYIKRCFQLDVQIPANTTVSVFVPAASAAEVQEGGLALQKVKGIEVAGSKEDYVALKVGSGKYAFRVPMTGSPANSIK